MRPILRENFQTIKTCVLPHNWTNNNCESANHQIKQSVDWKSQSLVNLVNSLYDLVRAQYKDLERALAGVGDFEVVQSMHKFQVGRLTWTNMPNDQRHKLFTRFMRATVTNSSVSVSSDNQLGVPVATAGGKKPGQRKRKRMAKTTTKTCKK